jgi:drug/metabolite transporter (DMT)-like permease
MKPFTAALLFAMIAAMGNAIFVYGTKKTVTHPNPFLFTIVTLALSIVLMSVSFFFIQPENFKSWVWENKLSIGITSIGVFFTYLGFYLLFSRFGASYYILYAVLSIVTTSILVAVIFFGEKINLYFIASIICAFLTIFFFFLGQDK